MVIKKDISRFTPFLKQKPPKFEPLLPEVKQQIKSNKK
tara:strand:- start:759 stop:872 length:114 start_codon:yes stop_codon:yes gene_type:complete